MIIKEDFLDQEHQLLLLVILKGENCADNIQVYEITQCLTLLLILQPINPADNATALPWDDVTAEALCGRSSKCNL